MNIWRRPAGSNSRKDAAFLFILVPDIISICDYNKEIAENVGEFFRRVDLLLPSVSELLRSTATAQVLKCF